MHKNTSLGKIIAFSAFASVLSYSAGSVAAETTFTNGAKVYEQNCVACHQAGGTGILGVFPPHKTHVPEMYNLMQGFGGRDYLNHVVQYGLTGPIVVDGTAYNGNMPAWAGALTNEQIADVLNYMLTAFGNKAILDKSFTPYTAKEIETFSGQNLTGKDVYQLRVALTGEQQKAAEPNVESDAVSVLSLQQAIPSPIYIAVQKSSLIETLPSKDSWEGLDGAHYMGLNADGSMMLASGFKTGNVYQIDTASGEVIATYSVGGVAQGVKISPDEHYGIAASEVQGLIAILDLKKHKLVKNLAVGKTPHNIIFNHDGSLAYVTLQGEGAISVIDMKTLRVSHKISTPGIDTPHNLDITDDDRYLWIRDFIGHVAILDLKIGKITKIFKVGNGHGGIDILPGGHFVATGAISDSYVTIIDVDKSEVVAKPEVGTGPHGVRASADGKFIYASITADNTIAVIDAKTFKVIRNEPVDGDFPFWIAVPGNY